MLTTIYGVKNKFYSSFFFGSLFVFPKPQTTYIAPLQPHPHLDPGFIVPFLLCLVFFGISFFTMSGFSDPTTRYNTPTNAFNRSGGDGTINVNVQPNMNELANRTNQRIFQVASEEPEASELLISSEYRRSGTPFDFTSNIGGPLFRPRLCKLQNAIIPQIYNINRNNNEFELQFFPQSFNSPNPVVNTNPVTIVFTLPPDFYTPSTFRDKFVQLLGEAIADQFPGQYITPTETIAEVVSLTVDIDYDQKKQRQTLDIDITQIRDSLGNTISGPFLFCYWLTSECTFSKYGKNVIQFPSAPRQNNLPIIFDQGGTEEWTLPSPPALARRITSPSFVSPALTSFFGFQFIYTRYVVIRSEALSLYAFGQSRVDIATISTGDNGAAILNTTGTGGGGGKVIGTIAAAVFYDPTSAFKGNLRVASVNAPAVGIRNPQFKLNEFIDFKFEDEFGFPLDNSFPPDNRVGPTLSFNVTY